jgi:hypothetical protein
LIVGILGSNPRLRDRELKIDAAKPFRRWSKTTTIGDLRAFVHDVRTFVTDPESEKKIENMHLLLDGGLTKASSSTGEKAA